MIGSLGKLSHIRTEISFSQTLEKNPGCVLGCPWKLLTIVSKLVEILRDLQPTYIGGYNLFTKYQQDIPVSSGKRSQSWMESLHGSKEIHLQIGLFKKNSYVPRHPVIPPEVRGFRYVLGVQIPSQEVALDV